MGGRGRKGSYYIFLNIACGRDRREIVGYSSLFNDHASWWSAFIKK